MGKTLLDRFVDITSPVPANPKPPPLPHYDPKEEAPKWDWYREIYKRERYVPEEGKPTQIGGQAISDDKPDWRGVVKNNVVSLPKVEPYNFGAPQKSRYFFFDTPDYADPFKKLWYSTKFFFVTGGMIYAGAGLLLGEGHNYASHKALIKRFMVPYFLGGMAASLAVVTLANLRDNKDDYLNYIGGGLVAATITGRKHWVFHFRHSILWSVAAVVVKYNAETNGNLGLKISHLSTSFGLSGNNAEGGFFTGKLPIFLGRTDNPSRDLRKPVL